MGHWSGFCLNFFINKNNNVKGKENILKNDKFFIACISSINV